MPARRRKIKRTSSAAQSGQMATSNSATLLGEIAGVESAVENLNLSTRGSSSQGTASTKSARRSKVVGAKSASGSGTKTTQSAAGSGTASAKGASDSGAVGSAKSAAIVAPNGEPKPLTPFFEGANAFDPDIGYFRVAPGQSPQDVIEEIKSQRGLSTNRSRTIRGQ
jgi:hypothetical protein